MTSEEESPMQVQQRNIREAEMLTSNLGEGGISQHEILSDIGVLKELAILQESMVRVFELNETFTVMDSILHLTTDTIDFSSRNGFQIASLNSLTICENQ